MPAVRGRHLGSFGQAFMSLSISGSSGRVAAIITLLGDDSPTVELLGTEDTVITKEGSSDPVIVVKGDSE